MLSDSIVTRLFWLLKWMVPMLQRNMKSLLLKLYSHFFKGGGEAFLMDISHRSLNLVISSPNPLFYKGLLNCRETVTQPWSHRHFLKWAESEPSCLGHQHHTFYSFNVDPDDQTEMETGSLAGNTISTRVCIQTDLSSTSFCCSLRCDLGKFFASQNLGISSYTK